MNPDTGEIRRIPPEMIEEYKKQGFTMPLSEREVQHLDGMNRAERRRWARKKLKREGKIK